MINKAAIGIVTFFAAEFLMSLTILASGRYLIHLEARTLDDSTYKKIRFVYIAIISSILFGAAALLYICQIIETSWTWKCLYIIYYLSIHILLRYLARLNNISSHSIEERE